MKATWNKQQSSRSILSNHSISDFRTLIQNGYIRLGYRGITLSLIAVGSLLLIALIMGYRFAFTHLKEQAVNSLRPVKEEEVDLLAQHVGRIEANLMRINALGERLVQSASLDPKEFNFDQDVGVGGPINLSTLKNLEAALDRRYAQLSVLEQAILTRMGQKELSFSGEGRVVAKGWISSFFGYRYDPFTGHKVWHSGVDIAGKEGSAINALAGGVVSYAARRGGYGHLVEIKHANGLSTRYAHVKAILVKPGQLVHKGETIALLGSTGRSTGSHLHLEVHKNGKAVDPGLYFPDFKRGYKV